MIIDKLKNKIIDSHHNLSKKNEDKFRIHCHNSFEVLYFVKGNIHYIIEGEDYYPVKNSLLLIPPGVIHGIQEINSDGYERYVVHIKKQDPEINELIDRCFNKDRYYLLYESTEIRDAFEDMYKANSLSEDLFIPSLCALLLKIVLIQEKTKGTKPITSANKTVSEIIEYINGSFTQKQSLDDIAARFYFSKHHLNEVFKKATGVTVWEYIIRKRIYKATSLMKEGKNATEAAYSSGFSDYSAFYKAYTKRLGSSPTNYK